MPHDEMTTCETLRQYKVDGKYDWRWKEVPVSEVVIATSPKVRCAHCWGAVTVHKQKVPTGPPVHVSHRSRQDSEGCRGGHYFKGEHRMSASPVSA